MNTVLYRAGMGAASSICLVFIVLVFLGSGIPQPLQFISGSPAMLTLKTMFISVLLEALPFVLLGVLVSSLLQTFVPEQAVRRFIPRNPVLGVVYACLLGIVLPICECGMIPVVRRLIRKGMPTYMAVTFILAGPVLNPVVYASTYMAFRTQPEMAYWRMGLAFGVAAFVGLLLYGFLRVSPLRENTHTDHAQEDGHGHYHSHEHNHQHNHDHEHGHSHEHEHGHSHEGRGKLAGILSHASDEFFEMGKYLVLGAFISAAFQTFVARGSLTSIGQGALSSNLFMIAFAYVISLCSTSDAFVAASFASSFSKGSLLAFLVFGPMIDLKSTLMLLSVFKKIFVFRLIFLVAAAVLTGSIVVQRLGMI